MSTRISALIFAATLLLAGTRLHSQSAALSGHAAQLEAMRAANADLLKRQEKTIETLEQLRQAAEQIKAMGKRS